MRQLFFDVCENDSAVLALIYFLSPLGHCVVAKQEYSTETK